MNLTYEQFLSVFYTGIIMAGAFMVLSVVLFILLKIPYVIGDLNGSNAKKAIANIRRQNISTGVKAYKSSKTNIKRSKITEPMESGSVGNKSIDDKKRPNLTTANLLNIPSEETQLLESNENSFSSQDLCDFNEGTVISNQAEYLGQTTLLNDETQVLIQSPNINNIEFSVRIEITMHESNQIIF